MLRERVICSLVECERRFHSRYPVCLKLIGHELPEIEAGLSCCRFFDAWTENIGSGGLCLISDQEIRPASLICCQISLTDVPVAVPALMTVQWVERSESGGFRLGLKFLFAAVNNIV